ncbi:alpha/beta hydrolase domain-containing protein [Flectobacillus longus]|uniref:alpha/beta hydrolase domain-containing protein n=1 Tax=Flectobacillus longus TaxID=2984207 RepID=UPI0024B79A2D|nr:alpha/beta hydrolase domain-containing protein [Flectobacillus longus]MDI9882391.1 alpha/beta hydrolase domain-containing protein [Flectobacillus longus]
MKKITLFILFLWAIGSFSVSAKITKIEILKEESYQNGRVFGNIGAFVRITGLAYGEVNPFEAHNKIIQDITLAPRNSHGMVEYVTEFVMLKPVDMSKSNGLLFYNVPNRGNAYGPDTTLMKRGYVFLWGGWQGDLYGDSKIKIKVPVATQNGKTIMGKLHTEFIVNELMPTVPLSGTTFTGQFHTPYETASLDTKTARLTRKFNPLDEPVEIPSTEWSFSDCSKGDCVPSTTKLSLKGGFDPNYIYEFQYTAQNPLVLGLGLAATRDIVDFCRYDKSSENPLAGYIKKSVAIGVSQCGNFLRTFLHLGFNASEKNQIIFDGLNVHVATRKTSVNIRFGRPGGAGLQHEEILFAGNEAPFTWNITTDPLSGTTGGILENCAKQGFLPKIMHTVSSTEYWQMRMSLRTTDVYGKTDLEIPKNVRIYHFASTQHGPAPNENINKITGQSNNTNSFNDSWRALHVALEQWVMEGKNPPASQYPKVADKTLAKSTEIGWQTLPNIPFKGLVDGYTVRDFGKEFQAKWMTGIVHEPAKLIKDKVYTVLVPTVDQDNNEIGGLHTLTRRVPLGTYTGWSLRIKGYGEGNLAPLDGYFLPFAKTKAERLVKNDPRLSLEERYGNSEHYVSLVKKAAEDMVKEGLMLPEDAEREIKKAEKNSLFE